MQFLLQQEMRWLYLWNYFLSSWFGNWTLHDFSSITLDSQKVVLWILKRWTLELQAPQKFYCWTWCNIWLRTKWTRIGPYFAKCGVTFCFTKANHISHNHISCLCRLYTFFVWTKPEGLHTAAPMWSSASIFLLHPLFETSKHQQHQHLKGVHW